MRSEGLQVEMARERVKEGVEGARNIVVTA
jgi:hypothetical protein